MSRTAYHAKYFAHDLTRRAVVGIDRLSMSLFFGQNENAAYW
jgi:hypothetical protein